jgi:hypothetical protein
MSPGCAAVGCKWLWRFQDVFSVKFRAFPKSAKFREKRMIEEIQVRKSNNCLNIYMEVSPKHSMCF